MKVKNFKVELCNRSEIKQFIETWHYSESINGVKSSYCFKLLDEDNNLIGAMLYGTLAMANQYKKYSDREEHVLELRRLCCIDETPKNTESYFIAKTLKYLKKNTDVKIILSYSDLNYGHEGTIYKASNFNYLGKTQPSRVILWNNKKYHDKAIRTKYKGKLKPFAEKLKQALDSGEAYYIKQLPKNIYIYRLKD